MTKIEDLRGDSRILGPSNPNRSVEGITKIARHHSATATGDVWVFQNHWRGTLGWGTGGYHEIILRDGSVQLIYRDNVTTNGVGNHNSKTYHICVVGNGSFTAEQEKAFDERAHAAMQRFSLKVYDVLGHNEFSGHASNSCPGTNMATVRSRLGASGSGSIPQPKPQPTPTYTVAAWSKRQVVSTNVLNVRAAQNTNSRVIKQLKRGQTFNATRITRNGESVNGFTTWFEVDGEGWVSGALVTEVSNNNTAAPPANVWHSRSGTVTVTAAAGINLRGTSSGDTTTPTNLGILTFLGRGQQVKFDRVLVQRNGHAFVRQPRTGGYGWLAIGPTKEGKVTSYWISGIKI
ncbi:SH3 domain-containing protein [Enterococcus casseliflavus]|uniref:N-acetylmuramoyl-L-alanine amidase n=1 Tax=Enterococcus casseliflavus TaxID=37734 RepID=UPI001C8B3491|nr:N-acetylmuramoyl-L-alanine amidase [Enterococcus casseliflavus]MBX9115904.1 SH3 domain-containing protein [Enterococcus casseliflavus]MBX9126367.1 SH3 domain-containing protein [Enterococcus casseliflavus]